MTRGFVTALLWGLLLLAAPCAAHGDHVTLGMSAAFTGPSRALGIELYRGSMAYFNLLNATQDGLFGHPVHILARDDHYDPTPAIQNTIDFIREREVLLLFDYVGTPMVTRVLPLLKNYADKNMYLFFPFTGAQPQREEPYSQFVFNLRDSYRSETREIVNRMIQLGRTRVAVFYQADAYGRSGWDGVRRALEQWGYSIIAEATYRRGQSFEESFARQVEIIKADEPDVVVSVGSYEACAGFIRDARDQDLDVPIVNLSFVGSENLLALLLQESITTGDNYTFGLINTQVVPSYDDVSLEAVREYRAAMDQYAPPPPEELVDGHYTPLRYSFVSFEGYLNARTLAAIFKRFGRIPKRHEIAQATESLKDFDLGIGTPVSFGPRDHQGLKKVYFTTVKGTKYLPIDDWSQWKK